MNPLLDRLRSRTAAFFSHAMVFILRTMLPGWHPESSDTVVSTEAVQDRRNADA